MIPDAQLALRRKFEDLQQSKECRKFFKDHLDLYQAMNLLYNEELLWAFILLEIWSEIWALPELVIKNGHLKPAFLDNLARIIRFDLAMEGFN